MLTHKTSWGFAGWRDFSTFGHVDGRDTFWNSRRLARGMKLCLNTYTILDLITSKVSKISVTRNPGTCIRGLVWDSLNAALSGNVLRISRHVELHTRCLKNARSNGYQVWKVRYTCT